MIEKLIDLFEKLFYKEEEDLILDARMEIRLNSKEKILIEKYCRLRGTDKSKLIRRLLMKEIDTFIKSNN